MVSGRDFSAQMPTDSSAIVINEAAAKLLGYANPLDHMLYAPLDNELKNFGAYHIIGVMKGFRISATLRETVTPLVLHLMEDRGALSIRIHRRRR